MKTSSLVGLIAVALLGLQSTQQAVAQDTTAPAGEPVYKVVSPLGESTVKPLSMAPRLETLDGKTVCLVWNHAFKADVTLPAIAAALKQRYPGIKIVPYSDLPAAELPESPGAPKTDSDAMQAALKARGADAVITGNGG